MSFAIISVLLVATTKPDCASTIQVIYVLLYHYDHQGRVSGVTSAWSL